MGLSGSVQLRPGLRVAAALGVKETGRKRGKMSWVALCCIRVGTYTDGRRAISLRGRMTMGIGGGEGRGKGGRLPMAYYHERRHSGEALVTASAFV